MGALSLLLILGCGHRQPTPPEPGKEDPIVQVVVPGAYGSGQTQGRGPYLLPVPDSG